MKIKKKIRDLRECVDQHAGIVDDLADRIGMIERAEGARLRGALETAKYTAERLDALAHRLRILELPKPFHPRSGNPNADAVRIALLETWQARAEERLSALEHASRASGGVVSP